MAVNLFGMEFDERWGLLILLLMIALVLFLLIRVMPLVKPGSAGGKGNEDKKKEEKEKKKFEITHAEPGGFTRESGIQTLTVHGKNLRRAYSKLNFFRHKNLHIIRNVYDLKEDSFKVDIDVSHFENGLDSIIGWYGIYARTERQKWYHPLGQKQKKKRFFQLTERPKMIVKGIKPASSNIDKGKITITVFGMYLREDLDCRLVQSEFDKKDLQIIQNQYGMNEQGTEFKFDVDVSHFKDNTGSKTGEYHLQFGDVPVENPKGKQIILDLKDAGQPTISHIEDPEKKQTDGEVTLTVHGTNLNRNLNNICIFQPGRNRKSKENTLYGQSAVINQDPEKFQIKVNVSYFWDGKPSTVGNYRIYLKDEYGKEATKENVLELTGPQDFIIERMHPLSVQQNNGLTPITLFGHHLNRYFADIMFVKIINRRLDQNRNLEWDSILGDAMHIDNDNPKKIKLELDVTHLRNKHYSEPGDYVLVVFDENGKSLVQKNIILTLTPAGNPVVTHIKPPSEHQDKGSVEIEVHGDNLNTDFGNIVMYNMEDKSKLLPIQTKPLEVTKKSFKLVINVSNEAGTNNPSKLGMYGIDFLKGELSFPDKFNLLPPKKKDDDDDEDDSAGGGGGGGGKDGKAPWIIIHQPESKTYRQGERVICLCEIKGNGAYPNRVVWVYNGKEKLAGNSVVFEVKPPHGTQSVNAYLYDAQDNNKIIASAGVNINVDEPSVMIVSPITGVTVSIGHEIGLSASPTEGNTFNSWAWFNDNREIAAGNHARVIISKALFHLGENVITLRATNQYNVESSASVTINITGGKGGGGGGGGKDPQRNQKYEVYVQPTQSYKDEIQTSGRVSSSMGECVIGVKCSLPFEIKTEPGGKGNSLGYKYVIIAQKFLDNKWTNFTEEELKEWKFKTHGQITSRQMSSDNKNVGQIKGANSPVDIKLPNVSKDVKKLNVTFMPKLGIQQFVVMLYAIVFDKKEKKILSPWGIGCYKVMVVVNIADLVRLTNKVEVTVKKLEKSMAEKNEFSTTLTWNNKSYLSNFKKMLRGFVKMRDENFKSIYNNQINTSLNNIIDILDAITNGKIQKKMENWTYLDLINSSKLFINEINNLIERYNQNLQEIRKRN